MDQWLVNPADQYWSNRDIGSAGQSGVKSYTLCSQPQHLMQAMVMPNLKEGDHHVVMHCLSESGETMLSHAACAHQLQCSTLCCAHGHQPFRDVAH